jgi:hypothetical protein
MAVHVSFINALNNESGTWTVTLMEEHRLKVFADIVVRKVFGPIGYEVTGSWRKLHKEEYLKLYSSPNIIKMSKSNHEDRLCGLVVRSLDYRSRGPGSIAGTIKKVVGPERDPPSLVSATEELLHRKVAAPVQKTENTAVGIRHADHVASSIRKS